MFQARFDSLLSAISKIGSRLDPRSSFRFRERPVLQPDECDALFHSNDLASLVCSIVPEEALSEPWELKASDEDSDLHAVLTARQEELDLVDKVLDAAVWARTHGDCFLYIATDQDPATPLGPVSKILYVRKIERRKLSAVEWYADLNDPKWGEPSVYQVSLDKTAIGTPSTFRIHESRLVRFTGARTSDSKRRQNNDWNHSILQRLYETLQDLGIAWGSAAALVAQSTQPKYKLKDLSNMLAAPGAEGREFLSKRIEMIDFARGNLNSIILDADSEDFSFEVAPLTSLPELLDRFGARISAAAGGIPVTKLFGISAAGMNATGEGDAKNWYRILQNFRRDHLHDQVTQIVRMLCQEAGQDDADIDVCWLPLDRPSALEDAQRKQAIADTDVKYLTAQVLYPDQVATARFSRANGFDQDIHIEDADVPETLALGAEATVSATEETTLQETAMNGAQVSSLLEVVGQAARGEIPRDTAVQIICLAFNKTPEQANTLLGSVGNGFEPTVPTPATSPFGAAPEPEIAPEPEPAA